ncbi:alpha-galactosidase [Miniimonas sp. S16]|uniref:alpha-galactosidase n=1 Tax=Miniimonas sp. S16 TaxID=2171623 RepID=UPI000D529734|nr:alpha-galactosidase [Miniimonas sp. S16]
MYAYLRSAGVSLLLDTTGPHLPRVLHWGRDLGELDDHAVAELVRASVRPVTSSSPDSGVLLSVLPEQSAGWFGTPGVTGHRDGRAFSTAFRVTSVDVHDTAPVVADTPVHLTSPDGAAPLAGAVTVSAADDAAGLALTWRLELAVGGLVRTRTTVTSTREGSFAVGGVDALLPLPREATEILDFTGRHMRERSPQRHPLVAGLHLRETRRARTLDGTLLMLAGEAGFAHRHGQVWGTHVAWSGNTRTLVEREMPEGLATLGGGELLLAGEVRLANGESYESPWVYFSYGDGLDALSARFHDFLRSRPTHPQTPRKALINVWEAVYFDHRLDRLTALADAAARVGLERYVLDDGWFRHRRTDTAGLGDWYVDETVWPDGLTPLVDHVTGLGLEFGLWFEPEMVNPDSDLARAHPEWILRVPDRMPLEYRRQQVLDLTVPQAWQYVLERMDAILSEYAVSFVKWDFNRDLLDAGRQATGTAGVHEQTLASYRLLAALRAAHPDVEFESCSSGGGRADLGILALTDRIWASDCIDPLERQMIEAGTGLLVPPELMGSHVASPHSHTTGRRHDLGFRAATALFGHLGVEWDLTTASETELDELARWVAAYREHRHLLHHGRVVRADDPDPALRVHGVVAHDGGEAIFAIVQRTTPVSSPSGRVRLPGLVAGRAYRVTPLPPGDTIVAPGPLWQPAWWAEGVTLSGRVLAEVGLQAPLQHPEHSVLLHVVAV